MKSNSTGSRAELVIGDKKFPALLREANYKPATSEVEHLSFQALVAQEVVTSTARVVLVNREKVPGLVHQPQSEISYKALPSHLIDKIEIDIDGMKGGTSIRISDLDIAENPNIEILSPLDTMLLSIVDAPIAAELPETEEETPEGE